MNLIERAKNILITPKDEWLVIEQENTPVTQLVTTYLLPLALIPAIASFIGYGIIGYSVPFIGHVAGSITFGISRAILAFITPILGVFVSAFIISLLAPSFSSLKDFNKALQLVVFSYTPMLIAGVVNILPSLGIIVFLAGIYGLYILYLGFVPVLKTPEDKVTGYFVVSIVTIIIVSIIISLILAGIFAAFALTGASMMVH